LESWVDILTIEGYDLKEVIYINKREGKVKLTFVGINQKRKRRRMKNRRRKDELV